MSIFIKVLRTQLGFIIRIFIKVGVISDIVRILFI